MTSIGGGGGGGGDVAGDAGVGEGGVAGAPAGGVLGDRGVVDPGTATKNVTASRCPWKLS